MPREMFHWNVTLQRDDGQMVEAKVSSYWSPAQPETADAIGQSAAGRAWWESKKQHTFFPTKVEQLAA